jgi:TonB family protein
MPRYTLLILSTLLAFSSCSKKIYQTTLPASPALSPAGVLLASYIWKEASVVAHKLVNQDTLVYNITKQFGTTDRDDLSLFREDGTFLFEEGKTKYTPQSSQKYYTGTWQLSAGQKELTLKTAQSSDTYQILQLDSNQMVLKLFVQQEENIYYYLLTYTVAAKSGFGQQKEWLANSTIYTQVDQQPQYPGGYEELLNLIRKKQQYPMEARKRGIEGKVVVQFVVSPEGVAGQFTVVESLGYGCDEAVLQTCQLMNRWQPGKLDGKPVPVQVSLPVVFKL